jgi:pyridoxal phosphate enzyme (YggS family)
MDDSLRATLQQRWHEVCARVRSAAVRAGRSPEEVRIVAVSKAQPLDLLEAALQVGIRCFGENYAQELRAKAQALAQRGWSDIEWHFIGHVQTNKVKLLAPLAALIHGVDSAHIADALQRWAQQHGKRLDILLQVNTSGEPSKHGCAPEALFALAEHVLRACPSLRLLGLMTIPAPNPPERVREEFRLLAQLRQELRQRYGATAADFPHLSMGMSADFEVAVEEGATLLRIGTAIFGERPRKATPVPPSGLQP